MRTFLLLLWLLALLTGCAAPSPTSSPPAFEPEAPTARPTLTPEPTLTATKTQAATRTPTPTLTPTPGVTFTPLPSPALVCPDAPPTFLAVGKYVMVSLDPPLASRLRDEAGLAGKLVGQAEAGQMMEIIAGPECADGYVWWQVRLQVQNLVGWTVEGDASGPWLVTPTPVPPALATPAPGQCPPFPLQSSLPNPANAADTASYLGKIFNSLVMPPELQFRRGTVVDLQKGHTVVQVEIKSSGQILFWLEKPVCRDADGRAYLQVVDVYLLPPLEKDQTIAVSSVDHCEVNGEYDPYLAALGELDASTAGLQPLQNLQRAWRVDLQNDRLQEIPVQGLVCTVYTGGP